MMKRTVFLILWLSSIGLAMAQNTQLKTLELQLGAQSTVSEGYVSLKKASVYTDTEAYYYSPDIDFVYLHGKTSGANLMVPTQDQGLRAFSRTLLNKTTAWKQRNDGILVKLNQSDAKTIFDQIQSLDALKQLFTSSRNSIRTTEGYDPLLHGPGGRLTKLQAGDVILFKSNEQETYGIGYISSIENPGTRGTLNIVLKYNL